MLFFGKSSDDPKSPYSASKVYSDHLVKAWNNTFGLPLIMTNYGHWQFPEKLIRLTISRALSNESIPIYDDGLNIRDWIFVEDHIDALIAIITKGQVRYSYCIGASEQFINLKIVEDICFLLDQYLPKSSPYPNLINLVDDRIGHYQRYAIDATRAMKEIGWGLCHSFN